MSSPNNGSWNDNPEQGADPQQYPGYQQGSGYGQQQPPQGQPQQGQAQQGQPQSIGQGYGQQHGGYGQQEGGFAQQAGQAIGNAGQQASQAFGQAGQQAGQAFGNAGAAVSGAGNGIGDLFSDFGFKKSLTERIASVVFLLSVIWGVIKFIRVLTYAWGSRDFMGGSVRNMGGFEAFMTSLEALAVLILTVAITRVILELAVNVARIAQREKA